MSSRFTHRTCSEGELKLSLDSHHTDQAAAEHSDELRRPIDLVVANRHEVDPRRALSLGGDHGPGRIRARIAARTLGVRDTDATRNADAFLTDPCVTLTIRPQPDHAFLAPSLAT